MGSSMMKRARPERDASTASIFSMRSSEMNGRKHSMPPA